MPADHPRYRLLVPIEVLDLLGASRWQGAEVVHHSPGCATHGMLGLSIRSTDGKSWDVLWAEVEDTIFGVGRMQQSEPFGACLVLPGSHGIGAHVLQRTMGRHLDIPECGTNVPRWVRKYDAWWLRSKENWNNSVSFRSEPPPPQVNVGKQSIVVPTLDPSMNDLRALCECACFLARVVRLKRKIAGWGALELQRAESLFASGEIDGLEVHYDLSALVVHPCPTWVVKETGDAPRP